MNTTRNEIIKKLIGTLLAFCMLLGLFPTLKVTASDDAPLAALNVGEIYEFRNLTGRGQQLRIESAGESYIDRYGYSSSGNYSHQGGGSWRDSRVRQGSVSNISVSAGGMLVLELKSGANISVFGNADNFKITRLVTPVFYTKTISPGATIEFINSGGGEHSVSYGGNLGERFDVYYIRADGTTTAPRNPYSSGSQSVKLDETIVLTGRLLRNGQDYSHEIWGTYTAFSGQPYRLTIDGQMSFPPSLERDTADANIVNNNMTFDEISGYSREARIMFNMILRTNYKTRPFDEYTRAIDMTSRSRNSNDDNMQDAYYRALVAMLNGDSNTQFEIFEAMEREFWRGAGSSAGFLIGLAFGDVGGVVSGYVGSVVGEFMAGTPKTPALSRELLDSYDDMNLLLMLHNNTNDNNLRQAIIRILHDPIYHDAFTAIINEVVRAFGEPTESTALDILALVLDNAAHAGDHFFEGLKGLYDLYALSVSIRQIDSDTADRIFALQGIREAAWQSYGKIINAGKNGNRYTEADLIMLQHLWAFARYCTNEQIGWARQQHTTLLNPTRRDERLEEESRQIDFVAYSPMWYPYSFSSQLPNRSQETADSLARVAGANAYDLHGSPSSWADENIRAAISADILPNNLRNNYGEPITRAEFAILVVALYEKVKGEITGRVTFTDTNDVNVQKAAHIGVVSGVGNNMFNPNGQLTREQAAVMLSRTATALGKPLPNNPPDFWDNHLISSWAFDAVGQVQSAKIMSGIGNNEFGSPYFYTREQSIVTIMRLFDYIK